MLSAGISVLSGFLVGMGVGESGGTFDTIGVAESTDAVAAEAADVAMGVIVASGGMDAVCSS